jgi:UDPglucose 6-dehydrogenase
MNSTKKISIFGLGKLGSSMLACFAQKKWDVIGVDIDELNIQKINNSISPIFEPGVDQLIKDNQKNITATLDHSYAVQNSSISFVVVPTPSSKLGNFSLKYIELVIKNIGEALKLKNEYHLIVITSTVLPGDMEKIINLLEARSGKVCNEDFSICYNPDFIALGSIIKDFLNPDMILIGQSDDKGGSILQSVHKQLVQNSPKIHRMNLYNAELAKIALNSYCTLKITFANILAEICENLPGGDVDSVTNAIGDDKRVGREFMKGGLSYGGPCFPRDNRAFAYSASKFGVTETLSHKTDRINNYHKNTRIPLKIEKILKSFKTDSLSVLGITYKKDTRLIEESASIHVIKELSKKGIKIKIYDPQGNKRAKEKFKSLENIQFEETAIECIKNTNVCFIGTPWDEFKKLTEKDFSDNMDNPVIFDAWGLYSFKDKSIKCIQIGKDSNKYP